MTEFRPTGADSGRGYGPTYAKDNAHIHQGDIHQGDIHYHEDLLRILPVAVDAAFNAQNKEDDPVCLPNTRAQILQDIRSWIEGEHDRHLFWLRGWAGIGKSTIARTICREYYDQDRLAASFFFTKGGGDAGHAGKFVTTLASHIAAAWPSYKVALRDVITQDDSVVTRMLADQWRHMIVKPLLKCGKQLMLVVIDALDECEREEDAQTIIRLLANTRSTGIHVRFLITSRPAPLINNAFSHVARDLHCRLVLHDVSEQVVDADILVFLQHFFTATQKQYGLSSGWPDMETFYCLVSRAAGLFIWAATAWRFVHEGKRFAPRRLKLMLEGRSEKSGPEDAMNKIYTTVIENSVMEYTGSDEQELMCNDIRDVLGTIVITLSPLSVRSISMLLERTEGEIQQTLRGLHAILDITEDEQLIRLHHPSFRDFLLSSERCQNPSLQVSAEEAHAACALRCIGLMQKQLKRDICDLALPGILLDEISPDTIRSRITPALQYACRYWLAHLLRGDKTTTKRASEFFLTYCLQWIEVMALIGSVREAIHLLGDWARSTRMIKSSRLSIFVSDVRRVLLRYGHVVTRAPLQVYFSVNLFVPQRSVFKKEQIRFSPASITVRPQIADYWDACYAAPEGHTSWVTTVVFSPDGQTVASGSCDNTVRLWDVSTGECRSTLEGHFDVVEIVGYSPDGQTIASGSFDRTVRLWDASTGACRSTLKGHSSYVRTVAFSPDGQTITSGSDDCTVRIWNASIGSCRHVLEGHSSIVWTAVYSPGGQIIASGSEDNTVRLWDVSTSDCHSTLEGHTSGVKTVIFSLDGQIVVSGSGDCTIRLWDVSTGECRHTLKGHSKSVWTVALSLDGQTVLSGSDDSTVRLWDTTTGSCRRTLEGHTSFVRTVVFSPDEQTVASGSTDMKVRIWDVATGECRSTLEGHSNSVWTVAFSPDGQTLASGSNDRTLRLWDVSTSEHRSTLEGHTNIIRTVACSPDEKTVVSGSDDSTVRLWDIPTGVCRSTLKGHSETVGPVVFSLDGQKIASGSTDRTVRLWDVSTSECCSTLKGHSGFVWTVMFSPDSQTVASGSGDSTVRLWDTSTGEYRCTFKGHSGTVWTVVFSPDGQTVASGSEDGTVRLWDVLTGACRSTLEGHSCPIKPVNYPQNGLTVVFSPDGKTVVSGSDDRIVRLWDVTTGRCCNTLGNHASTVKKVVSSPDTETVSSRHSDGTVELWDTPRGKVLIQMSNNSSVPDISFCDHGDHPITDGQEFAIRSHTTSTLSTMEACWNRSPILQLDNSKEWLLISSQRILWLPPEYRPYAYASLDNVMILGTGAGRMTFLHVSVEDVMSATHL